MEMNTSSEVMAVYQKPEMTKHEPVKIVQGSGCSGLYYTSLYYYY